jgi:hypothetical protein
LTFSPRGTILFDWNFILAFSDLKAGRDWKFARLVNPGNALAPSEKFPL